MSYPYYSGPRGDPNKDVPDFSQSFAQDTSYSPPSHRIPSNPFLGSGEIVESPIADPTSPPFQNPGRHSGYAALPPQDGMGVAEPPAPSQSSQMHRDLRRKTSEMVEKFHATIHWYVPASMLLVFLLGVGGAVAHHSFYAHLHGQEAKNQLMMNRYGTAIAFFTKACLVGSVVLAYRQRVWQTVRREAISLRGLDALFSVVEDPSWFFLAPEMYSKAKIATLLAFISWTIPLASVVAPGTLTTRIVEVRSVDKSCLVRSLNFSREGDYDFSKPPRHGSQGYSLAFYNVTPVPPKHSDYHWFEQPSYQSERLVLIAAYSPKLPTEAKTPCEGYNCTTMIKFEGPSYSCQEKSFIESPFDVNDFIPASPPLPEGKNFAYQFQMTIPEYERGQPDYDLDIIKEQGVFRGEPKLWFGYSQQTDIPNTDESAKARWPKIWEPIAVECVHQKAQYVVRTLWRDGSVRERNYSVTDGVDILPDSSPLSPNDTFRYREYSGYRGLSQKVRQLFLPGHFIKENSTHPVVSGTKLSQTRLVNQQTSLLHPNIAHTFPNFYHEIVISLLQEPLLEIAENITTTCNRTRMQNQFNYQRRGLWIGYALAMTAAFVAILFGASSILGNGMTSDITFSKIMVTTRNPSLDNLVRSYPGAALGGDPVPKALERQKLRFGVIENAYGKDGVAVATGVEIKHTAFGLVGEVGEIGQSDIERSMSGMSNSGIELRRRQFVPGSGLGVLPG
ncbi:hypothetical protein EX30DRAFT_343242 [Ascodesmis nigricans]|uniref:Uncharacterized protein n=1 Tax=Ascodesmis nigricans TaxID=341454 RepID=A0A4S2MML3_9PEZI|nr:hypothetical protein EX30DRAFT_343242 [Ascodesmis nigricans]